MKRFVVPVLLALVFSSCEDKSVSPKPPIKPPSSTASEAPDGVLEISGLLGLEKVGGAPGKNGEVYRIGGSEYYSLSLKAEDPKLEEAMHKGKLLLKPAAEAKDALEAKLSSLVGKEVVVKGRVRPEDRSDWANPNNMQALVETGLDGTRRTVRPGSIGAFIVTELRAR